MSVVSNVKIFKVSKITQALGEADLLSSEAIFNNNDKFVINSGTETAIGTACTS